MSCTKVSSVERVEEFINVPPEAANDVPETQPPMDWPSDGSIEFCGYSMRYRDDLSDVLDDISLRIEPGEKIGIVGRTGAGKTSLTAALFRSVEGSKGSIFIDGLNISTLGLHTLREAIVVVPQGTPQSPLPLPFLPCELSVKR